MGCCGSQVPLDIVSDDERIIFQKQLEMGLHKYKATSLISTFSSKEIQNHITIRGFIEALASLKINSAFLSYPSNPINCFYRSIGNSELIEAKKLKIACALLGQGTDDEKLAQLYKIYVADEKMKVTPAPLPMMENAKFEKMIRDLFAVAIKLIWVAQGNDEESMSINRLRAYETKLVGGIVSSIILTKTAILNIENGIALEDIKVKSGKLPGGIKSLVHPYHIRQFILKQYRAIDLKSAAQIFQSKIKSVFDKTDEEEIKPVVADTTILFGAEMLTASVEELDKPFSCHRGHTLKWYNDAPFYYQEAYKTWLISCDACKKGFSSGCWQCRDCEYDICEECGLSKKMIPPKLKCGENKELMWRCDVNQFYAANYNAFSYTCNQCHEIGEDAHWHCRSCLFDVCRKCGEKSGYKFPKSAFTCKKNHPLTLESNIVDLYMSKFGGKPLCDECRAAIKSSSQHCQECFYDLCEACSIFYNQPIGPHPAFVCTEDHVLHYFDSPSYYESVGLPKSFRCNGCSQVKEEECFHCNKCNFDLCNDCADSLATYFSSPSFNRTCKEGHLLEWNNKVCKNYQGGLYVCKKCNEQFSGVGSLSCAQCSYDICIKDINKD
ncbi:unnamed protein product [Blepharisma stoltei]|uniref:ZZ-type domain-containing protein n=1 Tax=Blepharisma stoltei TaxID=1481888 RepID=A0AAU9JQ87_9CILI|nr:unnamed protein product [Blepharisma stoltei]